MKCLENYTQIEKDFERFPVIDLKKLREDGRHFLEHNEAVCHYSIISNKVRRSVARTVVWIYKPADWCWKPLTIDFWTNLHQTFNSGVFLTDIFGPTLVFDPNSIFTNTIKQNLYFSRFPCYQGLTGPKVLWPDAPLNANPFSRLTGIRWMNFDPRPQGVYI